MSALTVIHDSCDTATLKIMLDEVLNLGESRVRRWAALHGGQLDIAVLRQPIQPSLQEIIFNLQRQSSTVRRSMGRLQRDFVLLFLLFVCAEGFCEW